MKCGSDFECGNGEAFAEMGPLRWRMQIRADRPGYDHYFCFRLEAEGDKGLAEVEVLPDPGVRKASHAQEEATRPVPGVFWRKRNSDGAWERILPGAFEVHEDRLIIHQMVRPGEVWFFCESSPMPFSDLARHLEDLPNHGEHVRTFPIGETREHRPLLLSRVTDPDVPDAEKGRVFILAGQHGTEFAGIYAAKGALDFLASRLPQAAALRRRYIFDVLPCANPDGNAHGLACFNSESRDPLESFRNAAAGETPATIEAAQIWRHLGEAPPDLILNFHAYAHPRPFGDPPYEGMFVPEPEKIKNPERRRHQRVINHALFYLTHGGSQHRRTCPGRADTLELNALAAWEALSALYVVQAEEGPHANTLTGGHVLRTIVETLELAQAEQTGL